MLLISYWQGVENLCFRGEQMAHVFGADYKLNRRSERINKESMGADQEELMLRTTLMPRIADLSWWDLLKRIDE